MSSANPYESPKSDGADVRPKARGDYASAKRLFFGWLLVFALNLVVPLFFGWQVTGHGGRVGMFLATAVLLAFGVWICANARRLGYPLVVGGVAVALSQVFPVLQIMAGVFSFGLAQAVGILRMPDAIAEDGIPYAETVAAGFVVTITTGGLLAAASIVAGLVIRGLHSRFGSRPG